MATSTLEDYPELLSLAVHELRSPASVIGGYLRMLQAASDEPLSDRRRHMIDEAAKSCARMVALIDELSLVSKLDDGRVRLVQEPLDLGALLRDVAEHVHEAQDRDVHLALAGGFGQALMRGDAARLRSAFDAVFRAILREKVGPASVVADQRREQVHGRAWAMIVVAEAASVQQSYERPRGAFDDKRGGLGLALPLARRVFEAHGGQIWSPVSASREPEAGKKDPISHGSAIVGLPLTE